MVHLKRFDRQRHMSMETWIMLSNAIVDLRNLEYDGPPTRTLVNLLMGVMDGILYRNDILDHPVLHAVVRAGEVPLATGIIQVVTDCEGYPDLDVPAKMGWTVTNA